MTENTQDNLVSVDKPAENNPKESIQIKLNGMNLHSKPLTAGKLAQLEAHLDGALALVKDNIIPITADQRREMPRMGPLTRDFGRKTLEYLKDNPALASDLVNVADIEADMADVEHLLVPTRKSEELFQVLSDISLVSGSEAYQGMLTAYRRCILTPISAISALLRTGAAGMLARAGGYMFQTWTFEKDEVKNDTFAVDAVAGVLFWDHLDISYTLRTNFESVNHKVSVGFVYRFK